jgi:predicted site-specific integrase-resolvase
MAMAARQPARDLEHELWLDEIIDLREAAALRKVNIDTLRSLIRKGLLKPIKLSERRIGMTRREATRSI